MSIPDNGSTKSVKTLAIRLEPDLHQQLSLIAQLRDSTITDEIREAIESHIALVKANPDLAGKADSVLDDIEREAAARRDAIASLFGTAEQSSQTSGEPRPNARSRGRKTTGAEESDS